MRPADNGGQAPGPHAGQAADQQDHQHPHQQAGRVGQRLQQVCWILSFRVTGVANGVF